MNWICSLQVVLNFTTIDVLRGLKIFFLFSFRSSEHRHYIWESRKDMEAFCISKYIHENNSNQSKHYVRITQTFPRIRMYHTVSETYHNTSFDWTFPRTNHSRIIYKIIWTSEKFRCSWHESFFYLRWFKFGKVAQEISYY